VESTTSEESLTAPFRSITKVLGRMNRKDRVYSHGLGLTCEVHLNFIDVGKCGECSKDKFIHVQRTRILAQGTLHDKKKLANLCQCESHRKLGQNLAFAVLLPIIKIIRYRYCIKNIMTANFSKIFLFFPFTFQELITLSSVHLKYCT
jgi:hypothetical protein